MIHNELWGIKVSWCLLGFLFLQLRVQDLDLGYEV